MNFNYKISASVDRGHSNPPLYNDIHRHLFTVTLHLQAERQLGHLYGIDMVADRKKLQQAVDLLPDPLNWNTKVAYGTTEELCEYFWILFDAPELQAVEVSECPEQITILNRHDRYAV